MNGQLSGIRSSELSTHVATGVVFKPVRLKRSIMFVYNCPELYRTNPIKPVRLENNGRLHREGKPVNKRLV